LVGEHDSGRIHRKELDRVVRKTVEELHNIELGDQRVSQLDKNLCETLFT